MVKIAPDLDAEQAEQAVLLPRWAGANHVASCIALS